MSLDDPDFFTGRGCVSLFGVFLAMLGIAAGAGEDRFQRKILHRPPPQARTS